MTTLADGGRRFFLPSIFEMTEGIFLDDPAAQHELLFRVPAGSNIPKTKVPAERGTFEASPEPYEVYLSRFDVVMQGLQRGDSFLANLTLRTPLALSVPLQEVILHSDAPYCLYVPGRFACFSPERFVRIADGRISTNPMKGIHRRLNPRCRTGHSRRSQGDGGTLYRRRPAPQ